MKLDDVVARFPLVRKLSSAYFRYRAARWRWHPRFRIDSSATPVDRPIFLLGTQGGGLTITSRILHRLPGVVSASGDHRYWAGHDEVQNVYEDAMPGPLGWHPDDEDGIPTTEARSWLFASEPYFKHYRRTSADASDDLAKEFKRLLRGIIRLNQSSPGGRLVDKSQSFSVRVGLVGELLRDCDPRFVLITRDPFAMCWRAATKVRPFQNLDRPEKEKMRLAVQHWRNTMESALTDAPEVAFRWWRFEDLLAEPDRVVREICEFTDLEYTPAILPQPDDVIPWGSGFDAFSRHKWYPMRTDVNDSYLRSIPGWAIAMVESECGELLDQFGYSAPTPVER